jgi:hypothetical protein
VYKRVYDAIRMPGREANAEKGAGIFGAAADRIRRDIAIIPQFGRAQIADNKNRSSRAPRDGLRTMTGRTS